MAGSVFPCRITSASNTQTTTRLWEPSPRVPHFQQTLDPINLGPASTAAGSGASTKKNPATPSSKKPFVSGCTTPSASASATSCGPRLPQQQTKTTTPRKLQNPSATTITTTPQKQQQQQRSAWAAKPSERRQPPFKPVGTPKAKLPLRTNSAVKTDDDKSPRPKGTASGGGGSGAGGSRVDGSDGAISGGGSSSPSKRPPPR